MKFVVSNIVKYTKDSSVPPDFPNTLFDILIDSSTKLFLNPQQNELITHGHIQTGFAIEGTIKELESAQTTKLVLSITITNIEPNSKKKPDSLVVDRNYFCPLLTRRKYYVPVFSDSAFIDDDRWKSVGDVPEEGFTLPTTLPPLTQAYSSNTPMIGRIIGISPLTHYEKPTDNQRFLYYFSFRILDSSTDELIVKVWNDRCRYLYKNIQLNHIVHIEGYVKKPMEGNAFVVAINPSNPSGKVKVLDLTTHIAPTWSTLDFNQRFPCNFGHELKNVKYVPDEEYFVLGGFVVYIGDIFIELDSKSYCDPSRWLRLQVDCGMIWVKLYEHSQEPLFVNLNVGDHLQLSWMKSMSLTVDSLTPRVVYFTSSVYSRIVKIEGNKSNPIMVTGGKCFVQNPFKDFDVYSNTYELELISAVEVADVLQRLWFNQLKRICVCGRIVKVSRGNQIFFSGNEENENPLILGKSGNEVNCDPFILKMRNSKDRCIVSEDVITKGEKTFSYYPLSVTILLNNNQSICCAIPLNWFDENIWNSFDKETVDSLLESQFKRNVGNSPDSEELGNNRYVFVLEAKRKKAGVSVDLCHSFVLS